MNIYDTLLSQLDSIGLNRYQITAKDIEVVEKYLAIIQKGFTGGSTWQELMDYGGQYGTSILIHEVVEIRLLEAKGLKPLQQQTRVLRKLLAKNIETHIIATYEEHLYLQEIIQRLYGKLFQVATLIKANRYDDFDLQLLLESDVGLYILEEDKIKTAQELLNKLKGKGK